MEMLFVSLIGLRDLSNDPDCKLCGKIELLPDVPVHDSLEENLVVQLLFKRYPRNKPACFVELDEGIDDRSFLIIIGKQLYLEGLDHNVAIKNQSIKGLEFLCD